MVYDFGARLKKLRMKNHLTQKELGERIGLSKGAISTYELGVSQPPLEILAKLAGVFGITTDYLLGIDNDENTIVLHDISAKQRKLITQIVGLAIELTESE